MREIKFRCWDNQLGMYTESGEDMNSCIGLKFDTESVFFNTTGDKAKRFSFEQFTGLEGVYESDRVKLTFWDYYSNDCVSIDDDVTVEGKIVFDNGGWFVEDQEKSWYYLYDVINSATLEVVGTIHDDTALLQ
jgi:hypothetical protein